MKQRKANQPVQFSAMFKRKEDTSSENIAITNSDMEYPENKKAKSENTNNMISAKVVETDKIMEKPSIIVKGSTIPVETAPVIKPKIPTKKVETPIKFSIKKNNMLLKCTPQVQLTIFL